MTEFGPVPQEWMNRIGGPTTSTVPVEEHADKPDLPADQDDVNELLDVLENVAGTWRPAGPVGRRVLAAVRRELDRYGRE